jgi:prepilin-type N-terminal cleavage/methylation domain-containing protein
MAREVKKRKAFTLVEILIALFIFSTVMVLATGIFTSVIGGQSLINVNSNVSKESQRMMRQISDDVTNAIGIGSDGVSRTNIRGILFFKANGAIFSESELKGCLDSTMATCNANGIVLFSKGKLKIYRLVVASKQIEYAEANSATLTLGATGSIDFATYQFQSALSEKVEVGTLNFRGLACYSTICDNMPFVQTEMVVQTKDYSQKAPSQRANLHLRTITAGRSY